MSIYVPICTGPCQFGGGGAATVNTLYEQQNHFAVIRERLEVERLATLTPEKMRTELASLDARIKAARQ